jgi:hypothetical protein
VDRSEDTLVAWSRTLPVRQQCFDAIVEEEALQGPFIGDRLAAALTHAFYLALNNDHPTTALAIVGVLLCGWVRSRVRTNLGGRVGPSLRPVERWGYCACVSVNTTGRTTLLIETPPLQ